VTVASGRRSQVELARRLCAAYVSFRVGARRIDSVLHHVPDKIGSFWINLARFVSSSANKRNP